MLAPHFFTKVIDWDEQNEVSLNELVITIFDDNSFKSSKEWPRFSGALEVLNNLGDDVETFKRVRHWSRRAMRFSFTARPV